MLIKLFISFFKIGCLSFGGGLAALPLIEQEIVTQQQWLSINELTDLVGIAQMTPGPIAVNSATFVGLRLSGVLGAIFATLGCITPSIIIISILTYFYYKYSSLPLLKIVLKFLRAAVIALIAVAGIRFFNLFRNDLASVLIFATIFLLLRVTKKNPIIFLLLSGFAGLLIFAVL